MLINLFSPYQTNKGGHNSGEILYNLKIKWIPIGCLCQRILLWAWNLVTGNISDGDFIMSTHNYILFSDKNVEDIIFDSDFIFAEV